MRVGCEHQVLCKIGLSGGLTPPSRTRCRRGQVLIEFALIALVLYVLLAAILDFGRALFAAQVLQLAADVAAREISRMPLPPDQTLEQVMDGNDFRTRIFDARKLVIELNENGDVPLDVDLDGNGKKDGQALDD